MRLNSLRFFLAFSPLVHPTVMASARLQVYSLPDLISNATGAPIIPETASIDIKGIVILGNPDLIKRSGRNDVDSIEIEQLDVPGSKRKLYNALSDFLGEPLNSENLLKIKKTIVSHYRDEGRPIIQVVVPEQRISSGVLQLVVYESKLGEIRSVGNKYFKSRRLINYVKLKKDEPIDANQLVEDLNWMNRNTFRQTDAFFASGKADGTTDIELLTKDRRPWRIYAGTDNTGLEQTGQERWFTGINFGNFLNLDQLFTYQFTSGNNYKDFNAHTAQWVIPLPWRNILSFYGGYSSVHTNALDIPFNPGFGTHGHSIQTSMRWDVPLPSMADFLNEFTWGVDWKKTNNTLTFVGDEFFGKNANLFQILAAYNLGYEDRKRKLSFTWENYFSPGDWLPDQSKARYNDLRLFATPLYYYTRTAFASIFRHLETGLSLHVNLRGQWSTKNLLSSEEYGIGGYDTVRGYDERQFNGDYAFVGNVELRTPQWQLFWQKSKRDQIQFLIFYDYGHIWVHQRILTEPKGAYIDGAGAGVRYLIDPYLTARLDYGHKLKKLPTEHHNYKFHFSVVLSY